MTRLTRWTFGCGLFLLAGCSGQYVLTAPDQIAPVGGETAAVLRVQRQEVAFWYRPAPRALVRMQVEQGPLRAAFTDKNGYAGAAVPVGDVTGIFFLQLAHTNPRGNEYETYVPTHVWDPQARVTAVDVKALPLPPTSIHSPVQTQMARLAAGSYIVYVTTESIGDHAELRKKLERAGYPRGPIVQQRAGALEQLRKQFPQLEAGVATSWRVKRSFDAAGLERLTLEQAVDRYALGWEVTTDNINAGSAATIPGTNADGVTIAGEPSGEPTPEP